MAQKFIISLLISLFIMSACRRELNSTQGSKYLKAFDSELIMLSKQLSETCAYRAMLSLQSFDNLPIPFQYREDVSANHALNYCFESSKGRYTIDTNTREAVKTGDADSVIITLPALCKNQELILVITNYAEENSAWDVMMPTQMQYHINAGNKTIMKTSIEVVMEHMLPIFARINMDYEGIFLNAEMKTKLSKRTSKSTISFAAGKNTGHTIDALFKMNIQQDKDGSLIFKRTSFQLDSYPVQIRGSVNYDQIAPETRTFISDFNRHSRINISSHKNEKIGKVFLMERRDSDRLSFDIIFNDQSTANMDELLLTLRAILNIKL